MLSDLRYRLRALFRRNTVESELDDELRFHFEHQVEKYLHAGLTRSEALRKCRLAFGGIEQIKEECREARGIATVETLVRDMRHALRLWAKNPGFALAAVAAIGLGIGANTAVFTLANAVLFKTLPFEGGGHIVYVQGVEPGCELPCDTGRSYPDFREFREQAKSFESMMAYRFMPVSISDASGLPERYKAMQMSANGFSVFGQRPVAGRDFIPADERPGATPVAILTYALWETRYAKHASIIGRTIRVNEVPTVVVGIMPPGMQFRVSVDLWVPLVPAGDWRKRENRALMMLGRLAKGATLQSARSELDTISRRLESLYPASDKDIGIRVREGKDYFFPRVRTLFIGLLIVVGLVLLVACANVANLLLGRAVVRAREISIRMALGAGRWRVIRQLLAESVTLSVVGGIAGWLLAIWGIRAFDVAIAGTGKPAWLDFSMDYRVFAYLTAITVGAGLLFGLAPALQLSKVDLHAALKDGGQAAGGGSRGRRFSSLLVAGEMAAAVMLLVGTVLVVQTLLALYRSQVGVNTSNVLTMSIDLPENYSRPVDRISFYEQLQDRLRALPGVESTSMASSLPGHGGMSFTYQVEGAAPADGRLRPEVRGLVVDANYFHTMDVRPLVGREFTAGEDSAGPPAAIVNRSFAARVWPEGNALGRRLRVVGNGAPQQWLTVVGVVPDIWQNDIIRREFQPLIYLPLRQVPLESVSVVARTLVPPATLGQAFRREVQALDGNLPVYALRTLNEDLNLHDWGVRVFGAMFAIFTVIAMLLASVGLYAVMCHSVNRRTQEIGVRLAMGATAANIMTSVFVQGMRQVALGLAVGLPAAFALTRVLRALLAGVFQPDPATFLIVTLVLVAVGVLACTIPARRASRVDPAVALRFE